MKSCVAVCTLKDVLDIKNVALVGQCFTENLGIENIVKAVIRNPSIRFLLVCGSENEKRFPGQALISLKKNGVDEKNKIKGAIGLMPFLSNLTKSEIDYFRKQVTVIDMVGVSDVEKIKIAVNKFEKENPGEFTGHKFESLESEIIESDYDPDAAWTADDKNDENWFVIKVDQEKKLIVVEHYVGYGENTRKCCTITGKTPESILGTIVQKNKVTKLYHAGYLGKELQKAAIALKKNIPYNQELEFIC